MAVSVKPLHPLFAGEATGIDLRRPIDAATVAVVAAAMDRYAVLVLPDQPISDDEQMAFSRHFGDLETSTKVYTKRLASPHLSDVSNLDQDNRLLDRSDERWMRALGNQLWHTDSSFKRTPAKYSMLSARVVPPEGGETEFADLRAAYDELPAKMKTRIEGLVAEHSLAHSRATTGFKLHPDEAVKVPPVPQVIVRTHPGSRRKTLYLASHASHIVGWPVPDGRMLLLELIEHATQRQFVYRHHWRVGDLVIWDNRCTMHRGRPYDASHVRDMRRTTIADIAPTLEQVA